MSKDKSKHRFLISGEVHFLIKDEEGEFTIPSSGKVNGVLASDHKDLGVKDIGRAQQILQMVHHGRMEEPDSTQPFDVFIANISYLGFSTDEKFNAAPKGTAMKEVDPMAIHRKSSGTQR